MITNRNLEGLSRGWFTGQKTGRLAARVPTRHRERAQRARRWSLLGIELLGFALLATGRAQGQGGGTYATVTVTNVAPFARQEVISIPWSGIQAAAGRVDTSLFSVRERTSGKLLMHQWESLGTGAVQNLLVRVQVPAAARVDLLLVKKKHQPFPALTYGRYVPERKEDFAWENDRIAFRMYGKALETTRENALGIDVWVKRTDSLVIDQWYKKGDYHTDHGQGLDYYGVGNTLGAGNIALYIQDSIWHSRNYTRYEVLDNGPLRSTFRLFYPEQDIRGVKLDVYKTISLDAGSQLNRISVSYNYSGDEVLPFAIGVVKRDGAGVQLLDEQNGILGYWEPAHPKFGTTGVGVINPQTPATIQFDEHQWLFTGIREREVVYYAGACWDRAGKITSAEDWFNYLKKYKKALEQKLQVSILKNNKNNIIQK